MKKPPLNQMPSLQTRRAAREATLLRHDLNTLRDSVKGLRQGLRVPVAKIGRQWLKKTTTRPSGLETLGLGLAANTLLDQVGISTNNRFSTSGGQAAARFIGSLTAGQLLS